MGNIGFKYWRKTAKQANNAMLSRNQRRYYLMTLVACCLVCILFYSGVAETWEQRQRTQFDRHSVGHHRPSPATLTNVSHYAPTSNSVKALCPNNGNLSRQSRLLTVERFGQLGNNMFQYAGLLGVAQMNNRTPFISPKSMLVNVFQITHVMSVQNPNKWKLVGEPRFGMYDPRFECLPRGPLLLLCYFQSHRYFQDLYPVIRKEFTFQPNIDRAALNLLKQLLVGHTNVTKVGVHVRRGDKLTQKEIRSGERVAPVSYFHNAFTWMRKKYTNVIFLVTSDDKRWVTANLKTPDVKIVPAASGPVHLSLLTHCDHVIMSVGTFGWWAGWLAGGDVIYFNQPVVPVSWKGQRLKIEEFFPKHWIGLGI